jgi:glycosyltransferase involved in cell wall biosynthesis
LKLIIVHYHFRPGGIRRVIELAAPHLIKELKGVTSITLASGEAADRKWNDYFVRHVSPMPVEFFVARAFNYVSEQKAPADTLTRQLRAAMEKLLGDYNQNTALVWAHNLGIGRNLLLSREVVRACEARAIPVIAHHHDWWFDNRWLRWPEMRQSGFRTLSAPARVIFPASPIVRHAAINRSDSVILQRHLAPAAAWLPNLSPRDELPETARVRAAQHWLQNKMAHGLAPVWILPCRLLRRKNVAEALLLARWLRPEAWLVTTGGVSSADEMHYFQKLNAAAHQHHWRLRLGVLQGDETGKPTVPELVAASEAVMLTSIQEGFGLPYVEAAAAHRPLIARALPNIAPDLRRFGFRFPQCYQELLVDPRLFDWKAEQRRQRGLFHAWKTHLPPLCRKWVGPLVVLSQKTPQPVSFSRLTLTAQLEVLARPARKSWRLCAPLNPFLEEWKSRTARRALQVTAWPEGAGDWLGGEAYARRFRKLARSPVSHRMDAGASIAAQEEFIRAKLDAEHLFPLLWSRDS